MSDAVVWHDLECGSYVEDLELWRMLAGERGGPVLDVGAGTGRVSLDLAAKAGVEVVALDADAELLAALEGRRGPLPVTTLAADARDFDAGRERFPLVLVPMQTVQLLGGAEDRARFLRCAVRALAPGGLLAVALADALDAFDAETDALPLPDMTEIDGIVYASRPLAVVDEGERAAIHRLREAVATDGTRVAYDDVIRLERVTGDELAAEGEQAGLAALDPIAIPETAEYVGSTVVLLERPA